MTDGVAAAGRRVKVRVAQVLCNPVLGAAISFAARNRIRSRGVVIDTSAPAFTPVVKAQLAFGVYEGAEIRFIRRYLNGFAKVLELGASLGVTASHALDVAAPGAEVVCVEANPHLLETLRATAGAAARRAGATVTTVHGAIAPDPRVRSRDVVLTVAGCHLGSRASPVGTGDQGAQLRVPALDLMSLVRGWTGYAVICDIEGAEAALILSAHPVLTGAARLVIELHETEYQDAPVSVDDLRDALHSLGFAVVAERGRVLVLDGPAVTGRSTGHGGGAPPGDGS